MDIESKPILSVIVPMYNVSDFIEECVHSILSSESDLFELILVNDGSTDDSLEKCNKIAALDARVIVLSKDNGGLVSARKAGLSVARGDYIWNVDGDDWVEPRAIDVILRTLIASDYDVVCCGLSVVGPSGKQPQATILRSGFYNRKEIEEEIFPSLIRDEADAYISPSLCTKAIKADLYRSTQMLVPDSLFVGEDAACSLPAIYHAQSLFVLRDCLYCYRTNLESGTKKKKPFSLSDPALLRSTLERSIDKSEYDFNAQLDRKMVHDLFIVSVTQFYGDVGYKAECKIIKDMLAAETYRKAVAECKFSKNFLSCLMHFALKRKWMFLIWLYSRLR